MLVLSICCAALLVLLGVIAGLLLLLDEYLERRRARAEAAAFAHLPEHLPGPLPQPRTELVVPAEYRPTVEQGSDTGQRPYLQPAPGVRTGGAAWPR